MTDINNRELKDGDIVLFTSSRIGGLNYGRVQGSYILKMKKPYRWIPHYSFKCLYLPSNMIPEDVHKHFNSIL